MVILIIIIINFVKVTIIKVIVFIITVINSIITTLFIVTAFKPFSITIASTSSRFIFAFIAILTIPFATKLEEVIFIVIPLTIFVILIGTFNNFMSF